MKQNKITVYKLLQAYDHAIYTDLVNTHLSEGWRLHGELIVIHASSGVTFYCREMVKYNQLPEKCKPMKFDR